MPKLKVLSGSQLIAALIRLGFVVHGQKGSHVKLKRQIKEETQTLTLPNHQELDKGTLKAIYRQSIKYISIDELNLIFYTS